MKVCQKCQTPIEGSKHRICSECHYCDDALSVMMGYCPGCHMDNIDGSDSNHKINIAWAGFCGKCESNRENLNYYLSLPNEILESFAGAELDRQYRERKDAVSYLWKSRHLKFECPF